jgi:hypothetical protein
MNDSGRSFRRLCWEMRGIIWLAAIILCIATFFYTPFFIGDNTLTGVVLFMILGSIASLCWAVWSSGYKP